MAITFYSFYEKEDNALLEGHKQKLQTEINHEIGFTCLAYFKSKGGLRNSVVNHNYKNSYITICILFSLCRQLAMRFYKETYSEKYQRRTVNVPKIKSYPTIPLIKQQILSVKLTQIAI